MPTLKINGEEITVEPGMTVIQAADRLGVRIPRYCYHPGLSIEGNCRICTVEIEKIPKLTTACTTPAADGMVVWTDTPEVEKARQGVLEFLWVYADSCGLKTAFLGNGGRNAATIFSLRYSSSR